MLNWLRMSSELNGNVKVIKDILFQKLLSKGIKGKVFNLLKPFVIVSFLSWFVVLQDWCRTTSWIKLLQDPFRSLYWLLQDYQISFHQKFSNFINRLPTYQRTYLPMYLLSLALLKLVSFFFIIDKNAKNVTISGLYKKGEQKIT